MACYTGQESDQQKQEIIGNPPDIILTNYVMLELTLTRPKERPLVESAKGLRFLVLDELHTYRGRQGADVAMLVRRVREACNPQGIQCVGTSATLAGAGTYEEQQAEVANVASTLFGSEVEPRHVIGETLRRATADEDVQSPDFIRRLKDRLTDEVWQPAEDLASVLVDPLSSWIESTFGIQQESTAGRLIRTTPRSVTGKCGAAEELSAVTGVPELECAEAIRQALMSGFHCKTETESPIFAFRLHQFISKGDSVYASLQPESERYITLQGQQFVPGDRSRILLRMAFCRECGQEYYVVRRTAESKTGEIRYLTREVTELQGGDEEGEAGYLFFNTDNPWPQDEDEILDRLPDTWLEQQSTRIVVRRNRRKDLPVTVRIQTDGVEHDEGLKFQYFKAPFRFCLQCGMAYGARQRSDFAKMATLGTEGRSTATTILSLSAIRHLRKDYVLEENARKLLSFTDNRQDASLQAGHFNDFMNYPHPNSDSCLDGVSRFNEAPTRPSPLGRFPTPRATFKHTSADA